MPNADPGNGLPSFKDCQLRVSSNNGSSTSDQAFLTIVLPDTSELERIAGLVADSGQEPEPREGGVLVRDPSQNALLLSAPS